MVKSIDVPLGIPYLRDIYAFYHLLCTLLMLYYLPLPIYFLSYTTFNLLFPFTILVLLFTFSNLVLFLPFTTITFILHVPFTVFNLLYTISSLHVLLFIYFLYTFYHRTFNKLLYTSLVLLYTTSLLFLLLLHTFYSRNYKLNNKTNTKIINST